MFSLFSRLLIFFSASLVLFACSPSSAPNTTEKAETGDTSSEELEQLRDEIESDQQTIEDLQAFVEMEQAKLEENPEYNQEFLIDARNEQQQAKESIAQNQASSKSSPGKGNPNPTCPGEARGA